jgi:hypothetical protein
LTRGIVGILCNGELVSGARYPQPQILIAEHFPDFAGQTGPVTDWYAERRSWRPFGDVSHGRPHRRYASNRRLEQYVRSCLVT